MVNSAASGWAPVQLLAIPQRSVLGILLSIIYLNVVDDGIVSRIPKFADNTKLCSDLASDKVYRSYNQIFVS